jgi:hypothetical protein
MSQSCESESWSTNPTVIPTVALRLTLKNPYALTPSHPLLCLVVLFSSLAGFVSAQEYSVEGKLTHTEFTPDGREAFRFQEEFKISVSGSNWIISEARDDEGKRTWKEVGFDGTNTYQLVKFPQERPPPGKPVPLAVHGSIHPWDMPAPEPMFNTSLIWLAYASSWHLSKAEGRTLRPISMLNEMGLWQTGFKVSASWTLSGTPPHLPERVAYWDDGRTHPLGTTKPLVLYPAFTNIVYNAGFTNINQMSVPAHFTLRRFNIASRASPKLGELLLAATDEGVAETISPMCKSRSFRPGLTGVVLIADCRLEQAYRDFAPRYIITNGDWKVMPQGALVARHERSKALPKANANPRARAKRNATLWAMVLTTEGFFALWLRTAWKGRHARM